MQKQRSADQSEEPVVTSAVREPRLPFIPATRQSTGRYALSTYNVIWSRPPPRHGHMNLRVAGSDRGDPR